jgi:hypothetical protein
MRNFSRKPDESAKNWLARLQEVAAPLTQPAGTAGETNPKLARIQAAYEALSPQEQTVFIRWLVERHGAPK